jgi:hypothetical protein
MSNVTNCPNCGAPLMGPFCSGCGQKRIDEHEYSLGHFIHHAFHDLTHLDAKVLGSIVPIVAQPGKATIDYIEGRRGRYLRPLQTFIILNVIFFFAASKLGIFAFDTAMYLKYARVSSVLYVLHADTLINDKARELGKTAEEIAPHLDERIDHEKRSVLLAIVPLFALFVMLIEWRSHRKYIEHLIFSIHFFCFWLVLMIALWLPAHFLHMRGENGVLAMMMTATTIYLFVALRRVYSRSWAQLAAAMVLTVALLMLIRLFRDLVFVIALKTL